MFQLSHTGRAGAHKGSRSPSASPRALYEAFNLLTSFIKIIGCNSKSVISSHGRTRVPSAALAEISPNGLYARRPRAADFRARNSIHQPRKFLLSSGRRKHDLRPKSAPGVRPISVSSSRCACGRLSQKGLCGPSAVAFSSFPEEPSYGEIQATGQRLRLSGDSSPTKVKRYICARLLPLLFLNNAGYPQGFRGSLHQPEATSPDLRRDSGPI